ncbi:DUF6597 domain-containing transcriptional factor [Paenibacillus sp. GCM10027626]|uniref:DUF6597 domain-containing transcriptional factor n=1 Tax=Paenibacillus sp. GCM10027626 TaxID=3273411 RepID=UPI00362BEA6A
MIKGILHPAEGETKYKISRHAPSALAARFVQHYWVVDWDLRGQPAYIQQVLSHPNVNLVFEPGNSRVYGVSEGISTRIIEGCGRVVGIKFKPGGFHPFRPSNMAELTGRSLSFQEVFQMEPKRLEDELFAIPDPDTAARYVDRFLLPRLPAPDSNAELACSIVYQIRDDRTIIKVDDIVCHSGLHIRSLQRLFDRYVGVSPKWVILRYRLHEAAERMRQPEPIDWPALALELGYYDQSHFIRDFKSIVGVTPEEYSRRQCETHLTASLAEGPR